MYDMIGDWEEEAQGEDLLSDEEVEPEDNLDYKVRFRLFARLVVFSSAVSRSHPRSF